jgi:protein-disulfide isomerase
MSIKRIAPIFVLLALVLGIVAYQSFTAGEAVAVPPDKPITEAEQATDVEQNVAEAVVADEAVAQDKAAPSAVAVSDEAVAGKAAKPHPAAVPEFVPPQPVTLATGPEAVAFAMGDPDAPVQIVEFTDYQCPFCQRYATETMPTLLENLVDSGRVSYAIKDLPLDSIHPEARSASVAARCAGEQEAYLPMHDAIFASQAEWQGMGDEAEAIFTYLAVDLDLNVDTFSTCMADDRQAEKVQANVDEAMSLGVNGTPFFFIEGYGVSGAQPYEMFEAAVELAETGELEEVIQAQARQVYELMLAQQAAMAEPEPAQPAAPIEVPLNDAITFGDPNAPVTIVEYSDFQCPFCARYALQTFPQIEEKLIETGKVRYVFKDLPLISIHPQAVLAAEASRCAAVQELGSAGYLAMHNILFERQTEWSGQADAADLFAGYAADIGLDSESFATCLQEHEFEAAIQADVQEAQELGFRGTPAFLINGQPVMGAQPFEVFEQAVEYLIAEASVETGSN